MFNGFFQSIARLGIHVQDAIDKQRDKDIADGTYQPTELSDGVKKIANKGLKILKWIGIFIIGWTLLMAFFSMMASGGGY